MNIIMCDPCPCQGISPLRAPAHPAGRGNRGAVPAAAYRALAAALHSLAGSNIHTVVFASHRSRDGERPASCRSASTRADLKRSSQCNVNVLLQTNAKGKFRVQQLAQGHFGMQMGQTGDRTADLQSSREKSNLCSSRKNSGESHSDGPQRLCQQNLTQVCRPPTQSASQLNCTEINGCSAASPSPRPGTYSFSHHHHSPPMIQPYYTTPVSRSHLEFIGETSAGVVSAASHQMKPPPSDVLSGKSRARPGWILLTGWKRGSAWMQFSKRRILHSPQEHVS
ncbi:unnamed protein product [Pleuronectes platessa]|uniref:Uncharacterized protein n=1 Tax=Pleuronectes platessa TaxID=8262 RepID=A0A9N7VZ58_PLEPL|nr:unnamed protein product [Pleuronectes platessa]